MPMPLLTKPQQPTRLRRPELDAWRGVAVLLMIIFHFCYDLSYYQYLTLQFDAPFWRGFRTLILLLFFNLVGIGLVLSHCPRVRWRAFGRRLAKLIAAAASITLVTWFLFPNQWIYFGVLHFIALSCVLALPFLHWPRISLVLGILIFILHNHWDAFSTRALFHWASHYLPLPRATQDLTRLIPWFGFVLTGVFIGHYGLGWIRFPNLRIRQHLAWLGRHALILYLVHQPVLFGLVSLWHFVHNTP